MIYIYNALRYEDPEWSIATQGGRCESTTPIVTNSTTPKKTCLKDLHGQHPGGPGEVTDGTHVTAGQLALALTQVADLAVSSGNNAAAIESLDD